MRNDTQQTRSVRTRCHCDRCAVGKPVGARIPLAASALAPSSMPHIGVVDERFQSYNIEMIEVTGGHFWRPYRDKERPGADSSMFAYRKSIDLANPRLRKLAAALGPAYLRVSGTWANTTFFDDTGINLAAAWLRRRADTQSMARRDRFARTVDAKLVTSFATGAGTRNSRSVWTPREARKFVAYTARSAARSRRRIRERARSCCEWRRTLRLRCGKLCARHCGVQDIPQANRRRRPFWARARPAQAVPTTRLAARH